MNYQINPTSLKDNSRRAKFVIFIFWVLLITSVIAIISSSMAYNLLNEIKNGADISRQEVMINDLQQLIIMVVQIALGLTSMIGLMAWIKRGYKNAQDVGAKGLSHTSSTAIWGFFIPFANLYFPYVMMKEMWYGTQEKIKELRPEFKIENHDELFSFWAFFVINALVVQGVGNTSINTEVIDGWMRLNIMFIVSDAFLVITSLMAIWWVKSASKKEALLRQVILQPGSMLPAHDL